MKCYLFSECEQFFGTACSLPTVLKMEIFPVYVSRFGAKIVELMFKAKVEKWHLLPLHFQPMILGITVSLSFTARFKKVTPDLYRNIRNLGDQK